MSKWCTRKIGPTGGVDPWVDMGVDPLGGSTLVSTPLSTLPGAGEFPPILFWLKFKPEFEFELFSGLEFSENFIGP